MTREGLLDAALDAARGAAAIALAGWRKPLTVEHKGTVDLVTPYDRASEKHLREQLTKTTGLPVVGEEEGGAADHAAASWYVDPIDGTTNFVHGHPYFCVSVGLVVKGVPVIGVVVAPAVGLEWTGLVETDADGTVTARRATRNGEPCHVSGVKDLLSALLATGFPYDLHTSADNNLDTFVALMRRCQAVRRCGSAAMDLCHVAEGTFDGYWERRLRPWDLAGGAAVVLGAGGTLTAIDGSPVDILRGHTLATNGHLHEALRSELVKAGAAG